MPPTKRYFQWLTRLFYWDGLLPTFVAFTPYVLSFLFPNNDVLQDLVILFVVIGALALRLKMAQTSGVMNSARWWQDCLFLLALLYLVCLESLLMLFAWNQQLMKMSDWLTWYKMFGIYLLMMGLAQFPFSQPEPEETQEELILLEDLEEEY